ncbi:MAG TPA: hypothetical protein EYO33_02960 [Phycisphaerales bacterium]|nr:hypothetical protein [Phycisphaerales bacterium]
MPSQAKNRESSGRHFTLFTLTKVEETLAISHRQETQLRNLALHYGRLLVALLDHCQECAYNFHHESSDEVSRRRFLRAYSKAEAELKRLEREYRFEIDKVLSKEQRQSLRRFLAA